MEQNQPQKFNFADWIAQQHADIRHEIANLRHAINDLRHSVEMLHEKVKN